MGNSVGKGLAGVNSLEGAVTGPSTPHGRGFQGDPTASHVAYPARARSLHRPRASQLEALQDPGPSGGRALGWMPRPRPAAHAAAPGGRPRDSWSHRVPLQAPRALGGALSFVSPRRRSPPSSSPTGRRRTGAGGRAQEARKSDRRFFG